MSEALATAERSVAQPLSPDFLPRRLWRALGRTAAGERVSRAWGPWLAALRETHWFLREGRAGLKGGRETQGAWWEESGQWEGGAAGDGEETVGANASVGGANVSTSGVEVAREKALLGRAGVASLPRWLCASIPRRVARCGAKLAVVLVGLELVGCLLLGLGEAHVRFRRGFIAMVSHPFFMLTPSDEAELGFGDFAVREQSSRKDSKGTQAFSLIGRFLAWTEMDRLGRHPRAAREPASSPPPAPPPSEATAAAAAAAEAKRMLVRELPASGAEEGWGEMVSACDSDEVLEEVVTRKRKKMLLHDFWRRGADVFPLNFRVPIFAASTSDFCTLRDLFSAAAADPSAVQPQEGMGHEPPDHAPPPPAAATPRAAAHDAARGEGEEDLLMSESGSASESSKGEELNRGAWLLRQMDKPRRKGAGQLRAGLYERAVGPCEEPERSRRRQDELARAAGLVNPGLLAPVYALRGLVEGLVAGLVANPRVMAWWREPLRCGVAAAASLLLPRALRESARVQAGAEAAEAWVRDAVEAWARKGVEAWGVRELAQRLAERVSLPWPLCDAAVREGWREGRRWVMDACGGAEAGLRAAGRRAALWWHGSELLVCGAEVCAAALHRAAVGGAVAAGLPMTRFVLRTLEHYWHVFVDARRPR